MPSTAQGAPSDEKALAALSSDWMVAIQQKDKAALERILAPDFKLAMPGDAPSESVGREEWIANAIEKDWSNFRYEKLAVRVDGDHATVTSRLTFNVAPMPMELDSAIVDVWQRRDGRWQVTNRYLGQSQMQQRLAFFAGALAATVVGAVLYGLIRLLRRNRRRKGLQRGH
jgi:ketosteroid isomerase-like protein